MQIRCVHHEAPVSINTLVQLTFINFISPLCFVCALFMWYHKAIPFYCYSTAATFISLPEVSSFLST